MKTWWDVIKFAVVFIIPRYFPLAYPATLLIIGIAAGFLLRGGCR